MIAKKTNLDHQRIINWFFVRSVLATAWQLENDSDPGMFLPLAIAVAKLTKFKV